MAEELSLLNSVEQEALEVREALPRARAIQAWLRLAARRELSEDVRKEGADYLRLLTPKKLKKIRRELAAATQLLESMPFVFDASEGMLPSDYKEEVLRESSDDNGEEHPEDQAGVGSLQNPTGLVLTGSGLSHEDLDSSDPHREDSSSEIEDADNPAASDVLEIGEIEHSESLEGLSESGMMWAKRLLGNDYDFENKTIDAIASGIYEAAGSFQARRQGDGKKIDPIARIRRRLEGKTNQQVADEEGYSRESVAQWFGVRIDTKVRRLVSEATPGQENTELSPEPRFIAKPFNVSKKTAETAGDVTVDHTAAVRNWAQLMELDQDEAEHLAQVLDPSFTLQLNGIHKSTRHRFRLFMQDRLPVLESSDLDLSGNEIARLSALFGRVKENGEYKFTLAPQSAYEVTHDDGYLVPERQVQLTAALQKIHDYMSTQATAAAEVLAEHSKEDLPEIIFISALQHAGFTSDEAKAIKDCTEFDDNGQPRPRIPESQDALRKLQTILVVHSNRLDAEADRDVMSSLRMLTNTAFGQKTIRDVYHRLHGRDQSITYDDVTKLLQDGIIKLTS